MKAASTAVDQKVIVFLKSQPAAERVGTAAAKARSAEVAAVQAPLVDAARSAGAVHVKRYSLINAFGATVSAAEEAALKSDSRVAKVIPDSTIREGSTQTPASVKQAAASPSLHTIPGACAANGKSQLDPEGLSSIHAASDDPKAVTASSLGFTGKGVKVAYIAEGIDTHNVNFLRDPSDPSSTVFSDYKDFSGDGTDADTTGGEAFLDANAIAGQGKHVYSTRHFTAQNASSDCNVRIQGTAPGVSLVGLKVFAQNAATTTSAFLQAIDYAVETAHVDVLNESFGQNAFPDVTSVDALSQADDAAVAAGVTVTASSGDAGPSNTIGSPASDPKVISLGASTNFRLYAQSNYGSARYFATKGWLNNNPSALSSSGFNENAQTINLLAPGDLSWASCTPTAQYADCTDYRNNAPSDLEIAGGTSQSAPLTAGVAALVIQAYAKAHDGAKPSPALIKELLTSTATDLGGPSTEQGSGLINAYAAVRAAQSVTPEATSHRHGSTLLKSVDALHSVDSPGVTEHYSVKVTNAGASAQTYSAAGRTLGADTHVDSGSVSIADDSSGKIGSIAGATYNVEKFTFTVPAGQQRLEGSIVSANSLATAAVTRLSLIDPTGHYAGYSLPQGVGNHGNAIVYKPAAGTWTGYVTATAGAFKGKVLWRVATQKNASYGSVTPSSFTLASGASRTVKVAAKTPSGGGDLASAVVFTAKGGATTTIPVTLRSTIDVGKGGAFSGTLTGGNGRAGGPAQTEFYRFKVGAGTKDITANLKLTKNAAKNVVGLYLVSPDGNTQGYGQNTISGTSTETTAAVPTISASAFAANPASGVWTLVVGFSQPVSGDVISQKFTGNIVLNAARAKATGLPTSAKTVLKAGVKVNVPVRIANTSASPISAFVDARLKAGTTLRLASLGQEDSVDLPLTADSNIPVYFVPTQTKSLRINQTSTVASEFDVYAATFNPDLASSTSCSTSPSLSYAPSGGRIANGIWAENPAECGPYAGAAPSGKASVTATVSTKAFDPAVTSARGDVELTATDPTAEVAPLLLGRGKSGTINVSITPKGKAGTVVSGYLFVDTVVDDVPPYGQFGADELVRIPYTYTIG